MGHRPSVPGELPHQLRRREQQARVAPGVEQLAEQLAGGGEDGAAPGGAAGAEGVFEGAAHTVAGPLVRAAGPGGRDEGPQPGAQHPGCSVGAAAVPDGGRNAVKLAAEHGWWGRLQRQAASPVVLGQHGVQHRHGRRQDGVQGGALLLRGREGANQVSQPGSDVHNVVGRQAQGGAGLHSPVGRCYIAVCRHDAGVHVQQLRHEGHQLGGGRVAQATQRVRRRAGGVAAGRQGGCEQCQHVGEQALGVGVAAGGGCRNPVGIGTRHHARRVLQLRHRRQRVQRTQQLGKQRAVCRRTGFGDGAAAVEGCLCSAPVKLVHSWRRRRHRCQRGQGLRQDVERGVAAQDASRLKQRVSDGAAVLAERDSRLPAPRGKVLRVAHPMRRVPDEVGEGGGEHPPAAGALRLRLPRARGIQQPAGEAPPEGVADACHIVIGVASHRQERVRQRRRLGRGAGHKLQEAFPDFGEQPGVALGHVIIRALELGAEGHDGGDDDIDQRRVGGVHQHRGPRQGHPAVIPVVTPPRRRRRSSPNQLHHRLDGRVERLGRRQACQRGCRHGMASQGGRLTPRRIPPPRAHRLLPRRQRVLSAGSPLRVGAVAGQPDPAGVCLQGSNLHLLTRGHLLACPVQLRQQS